MALQVTLFVRLFGVLVVVGLLVLVELNLLRLSNLVDFVFHELLQRLFVKYARLDYGLCSTLHSQVEVADWKADSCGAGAPVLGVLHLFALFLLVLSQVLHN